MRMHLVLCCALLILFPLYAVIAMLQMTCNVAQFCQLDECTYQPPQKFVPRSLFVCQRALSDLGVRRVRFRSGMNSVAG